MRGTERQAEGGQEGDIQTVSVLPTELGSGPGCSQPLLLALWPRREAGAVSGHNLSILSLRRNRAVMSTSTGAQRRISLSKEIITVPDAP